MEALEGRDVPSTLVFEDTFTAWSTGGSRAITVTVTADSPGFEGLYHWNYRVTNTSPFAGMDFEDFQIAVGGFAVDNLYSSLGWASSVGSYVSWEYGGGPVIEPGEWADFSFTTLPIVTVLKSASAGASGGARSPRPIRGWSPPTSTWWTPRTTRSPSARPSNS